MTRTPPPPVAPAQDAAVLPAIPPGMDALRVLSISHQTAPLDALERMALSTGRLDELHRAFAASGFEAVAISTCNRTELYWTSRDSAGDATIQALLFAACACDAPARLHFVEKSGLAAARHLFRVAVGLESMVMGESEVLGQVRAAIDLADRHDASGFFVSGLFRAALRFGGRARQETGIGNGALSVVSAGIQLLTRVHPDLESRTVLVLGAGITGIKAARHLRAERVGRLVLLNRTAERAAEAAADLGCEAASLEDLAVRLVEADAVVAAAQVEAPIVGVEAVREALARRDGRPLVLLDLSMPRAIDPACAGLPGVAHHDLSGLEEIVAKNRVGREREIPRVEALLERELALFDTQVHEATVRPVLAELRQLAESIRSSELERALAGSDGSVDHEVLERVTRRIVDRLLHGPTMALRRGDLALDGQHAHYLRLMFGLTGEAQDQAPGGSPDPRAPRGTPHGTD